MEALFLALLGLRLSSDIIINPTALYIGWSPRPSRDMHTDALIEGLLDDCAGVVRFCGIITAGLVVDQV